MNMTMSLKNLQNNKQVGILQYNMVNVIKEPNT